jgi:glutamate dehydrogenase/leucine dehydrogenase
MWWGLQLRTERARIVQARKNTSIEGKRVIVSGSGNVAQFAVEKLLQLGAVPVTMSDSSGTLYEPEGFTIEQLSHIMAIKRNRGRLAEFQLSPQGTALFLCHSPAPAFVWGLK